MAPSPPEFSSSLRTTPARLPLRVPCISRREIGGVSDGTDGGSPVRGSMGVSGWIGDSTHQSSQQISKFLSVPSVLVIGWRKSVMLLMISPVSLSTGVISNLEESLKIVATESSREPLNITWWKYASSAKTSLTLKCEHNVTVKDDWVNMLQDEWEEWDW